MTGQFIVIGAANFHYWYPRKLQLRELEGQLVDAISPNSPIDGYELTANWGQLYSWSYALTQKEIRLPGSFSFLSRTSAKHILNNGSNTLHIPSLKSMVRGTEKSLISALEVIYAETGINDFTTHPDGCSLDQVIRICEMLPSHLRLSIENMDPRKDSYKTINELSAILHNTENTNITFDVCHWIENKQSLDSMQLNIFMQKFGNRVNKIHYSVPASFCQIYQEHAEIETSHYLQLNSNQEISLNFADYLPDNTHWVLEGVVPVGRFDLLIEEASNLRAQLGHSHQLAVAA